MTGGLDSGGWVDLGPEMCNCAILGCSCTSWIVLCGHGWAAFLEPFRSLLRLLRVSAAS